MNEMSCSDAMTELLRLVHEGEPLGAARAHLASCARCAETLDTAMRVQSMLAAEAATENADANAVSSAAIREVRRRNRLRTTVIAFLGVLVVAFFTWIFIRRGTAAIPLAVAVVALGSVIAGLAALGLWVYRAVRAPDPERPERLPRLYKRLRPGYQLSGVCLGLSEQTGIPVGTIRLLFVVLAFVKGAGIILYVLLDLFLPVHPADRRNLLRFRVARWLRAR